MPYGTMFHCKTYLESAIILINLEAQKRPMWQLCDEVVGEKYRTVQYFKLQNLTIVIIVMNLEVL